MRIITVNLPESYLKTIDHLVGENALYPSRSELIRVAVREFLIKELNSAQNFVQFQPQLFKQAPEEHKSEEINDALTSNFDVEIDDTLEEK